MPVAAAGILSNPLSDLRNIMKDDANVQAFLGVPGDASAAEALIFLMARRSATVSRPFIVLSAKAGTQFERVTMASTGGVDGRGMIGALLEKDAGEGLDDEDAHMTFANAVGLLYETLLGASGRGGKLQVVGIQEEQPVMRSQATESEDYFQHMASIVWRGQVT